MKLPDPIKHQLEEYCGINYEVIGKASIASLIRNRKIECNLPSDEAYFAYLLKDKNEFSKFVEGFLVPKTWFFRDTNPYVHLAAFSSKFDKSTTLLRILSIPCSSGEETYSIAMALIDAGWSAENLSIHGVDLGQQFLDIAEKGIYSSKSFSRHDPCNKSKFFDQIDDKHFSVKENIRRTVHFMPGNIIDPMLFNESAPFHAIFARNILMYLSLDARKKALTNLDRLLMPNGLLFLGHADNISLLSDKFRPTGHPSAFVFEKSRPLEEKPKRINKPQPQKKILSKKSPPNTPTKSIISNPDLLKKAKEFANKGLLNEANECSNQYIETFGPSTEVYFLMGLIFAAQDNLDAAEEAYKKAIYLDNENFDALFQFELLCIIKGDWEQAKILHDRLIRLKNNK